VRNYPYGEILCHLLGYVGEITYDEVKNNETYSIGDYIGRMGLEQFYEKRLRGTDGVEYVEVDVRGRDLGTLSEKRPIPIIPGHDLITTIDLALSESVSVYLKDYKKAACVCLDPRNGEVLVLYSKPGFDPNLFSHGLGSEDWIRLNNDPDAPMYNRAIMSCYPPGSTFKPFVALAALDAAMVDENRRFEPCRGEYRLGTRIFKCWKKHGSLNLIDGVIHSCDIYFYQLGRLIGIDTLYERANRVGLGKITGIDLPNEKAGLLPDRRWFENRYGKNWTEGHILNLSIGQGDLLVTPLQLACAFTTFANNGMIVIPRLLKDTKPDYRRSGLSEEAIAKIKKSLAGVVSAGTGTLARIRQCTVCGKTGTAQNPHGDDHALFVGFAPADDPKILVCIIVENAGHGGSVAAPIAGRIMNLYLESTDNQISGEPVIQVTCSKKPIQH
jgi:penicillin-binding protein 2